MRINHDIVSLLFQNVHVRKFDSKVMVRVRVEVVCVCVGTENNHKTNNVSVVQDTMRPVFVLRAVRMSLHKNYTPPSEINDRSVFQSTTV